MSCWCLSKAAMPGHTKDTHAHARKHTRFGETPLPSAAPGITSVQNEVVLRTSTYQETTQTASHSLTAHGDAIKKRLKKNRLEWDNQQLWRQLWWGIKDWPLTRVRSWGGTIKTRVLQYIRTWNTGYCGHITEGNRKLLCYKSKAKDNFNRV